MSALSWPRRPPRARLLLPLPEHGPAPAVSPGPRIGLLGGSFNPAHEGHRYISVEALKRLRLDEVWWLVSPQNPLKPPAELAPLAERLERARRVARHPRIRVLDLEARFGTFYTVDTLRRLLRFRRYRFVWLIGADNLVQMPRWRHWWRIFRLVPIAVFERKSYSYDALAGRVAHRFAAARLPEERAFALADLEPPRWVFMRLRPHPASATAIRRAGGWPQHADRE